MNMGKIREEVLLLEQREVARQIWKAGFLCREIAGLAGAGQFLMLQVAEGADPLLRRPFSFHRIWPEKGEVEILYRVTGAGTLKLSRLLPGSRLSILGPLGNGFEPPAPVAEGGPPVVVAGGIGVAPIFELIAMLNRTRPDQTPLLLYGARTGSEMLPDACFAGLDVRILRCTDDGSLGEKGRVPQLLSARFSGEGVKPSVLYACGPLAMQVHLARWAELHAVPAQLSLEALMACGVGACLGCALPAEHSGDPAEDRYVHVCKDGPIFPAGAIRWSRIQRQYLPAPTWPCS